MMICIDFTQSFVACNLHNIVVNVAKYKRKQKFRFIASIVVSKETTQKNAHQTFDLFL